MKRRWIIRLLLLASTLVLLVYLFDRKVTRIYWVGSSDLEVVFEVKDANGTLLENAIIEVESDGGFYDDESEKKVFFLTTDAKGVASKVCRHSMSMGQESGLGFTNTFAVHLPFRRFRVAAEGLKTCHWIELDDLPFRQKAHQTENGNSRVIVPVTLDRD